MITSRLSGGLGNQLFQYAAGRRLAIKQQTDLLLDTSVYLNAERQGDTSRRFELGVFNIQARVSDARIISAPPRRWRLGKSNYRTDSAHIEESQNFAFSQQLLNAPDGTVISGYWQSERYFSDISEQLRSDLQLVVEADAKNQDMLARIRACNAVSVHVRRGDYVENMATNSFHGLIPLEYYCAAMNEVASKVEEPRFFVISDDPRWCESSLKVEHDMIFVEHNDVDHGWDDMRLMSACHHHIIANSSFSWWGAWLNPDPSKIVYAPQRWFLDPAIDATRIIPVGWCRL